MQPPPNPTPVPVQLPSGPGFADDKPLAKATWFELTRAKIQSVDGASYSPSPEHHLPGTGYKPFVFQSVGLGAAMTGTIQGSVNASNPWTVETGFADVDAITQASEGKRVTNSLAWWRHKIAATGNVQAHCVAGYGVTAEDDLALAEVTLGGMVMLPPQAVQNHDEDEAGWNKVNIGPTMCLRDVFAADGSSLACVLAFGVGCVRNMALSNLEINEGADLTVEIHASGDGTNWRKIAQMDQTFHAPLFATKRLTVNQEDLFVRLNMVGTGIDAAKWECASELYFAR